MIAKSIVPLSLSKRTKHATHNLAYNLFKMKYRVGSWALWKPNWNSSNGSRASSIRHNFGRVCMFVWELLVASKSTMSLSSWKWKAEHLLSRRIEKFLSFPLRNLNLLSIKRWVHWLLNLTFFEELFGMRKTNLLSNANTAFETKFHLSAFNKLVNSFELTSCRNKTSNSWHSSGTYSIRSTACSGKIY